MAAFVVLGNLDRWATVVDNEVGRESWTDRSALEHGLCTIASYRMSTGRVL